MKYPFKVTINDQKSALRIKDDVQIGHYFVFVKHKRATSVDRLERLLVKKYYKTSVLPLVNQPIKLDGVTITPEARQIGTIGCIVSDANFYRAEQDVVRLFMAFPKPPNELLLVINCNGELFTERPVKLSDGVGIETLFNCHQEIMMLSYLLLGKIFVCQFPSGLQNILLLYSLLNLLIINLMQKLAHFCLNWLLKVIKYPLREN